MGQSPIHGQQQSAFGAPNPGFQPPARQNVPHQMGQLPELAGSVPEFQPLPRQMVDSPARYRFLRSGHLNAGHLINAASQHVHQKLDAMILEWERDERDRTKKKIVASWSEKSTASITRYIKTRRKGLSKARNPPQDNDRETFACDYCTNNGKPCVLICDRGPVVVPLHPPSELKGLRRWTTVIM